MNEGDKKFYVGRTLEGYEIGKSPHTFTTGSGFRGKDHHDLLLTGRKCRLGEQYDRRREVPKDSGTSFSFREWETIHNILMRR